MNPATIFMIGQGISAVGTILGGIGAKKESELNAFNLGTEKVLNSARADEMALARKQEYELATATNIATQSKGTDLSSRSVEAFLKAQKEMFGKDIKSIQNNTFRENLKITAQQAGERRRGKTALISSLFSAGTTAAETYVGYQRIKKEGP